MFGNFATISRSFIPLLLLASAGVCSEIEPTPDITVQRPPRAVVSAAAREVHPPLRH